MKKIRITLLSLLALVLLVSWGGAGHYRISEMTGLIFTGEMFEFNNWLPYIADHASDADDRKSWDQTEGPKHYIDIDNYPVFISEGKIPQTLDSCINLYGASFVEDNGYLPWATLASYDTLVACFLRYDWDKARSTTADLSHYVADGHMPLHITRNYNGQYSGNYGIHSRYESYMVSRYLDQLFYTPESYGSVENVRGFVFSYLYRNNRYVDSIMNADSFAQQEAGDDNSTLYFSLLWGETDYLTQKLFSQATTALVSLIYQAWTDAGKPEFNSLPPEDNTGIKSYETGLKAWPNPFSTEVAIRFTGTGDDVYTVIVTDPSGRIVEDLGTFNLARGEGEVLWQPDHLVPGDYYLVIRSEGTQRVLKLVCTGF